MNRTFRSTIVAFATAFATAFASLSVFGDVAGEWKSHAVAASREARQSPPAASRSLAVVEKAITAVEAVAPIGNGNGTGNGSSASAGERHAAAVAVAAFAVLENLYPDQRESLEARLAVTFSHIPETDAKAEGAALGRRVANRLLFMP